MHKPLADIFGHRGVEFGVFEHAPGEWEWTFYPKVGQGQKTKGLAKGTRAEAVAACKAAIDEWKDSWRGLTTAAFSTEATVSYRRLRAGSDGDQEARY